MSNVTPEPTIARKIATKAGYGVAFFSALTVLVLVLARVIDPMADWPLVAPPVLGVVTYFVVWLLLSVTFEFE